MDLTHVATWNVLHRVHAENWDEAPARHFPDERVRIEGVSQRVLAMLGGGVEVICLQEVSGDQLASLRATLGAAAQVLAFRYPRLPAPRTPRPHVARLADPSEHLVTVVALGRAAHRRTAEAFPDDGGKGLLAIEVEHLGLVINTHVSYGEKRPGQLTRLAAVARSAAGPSIVLGDFNADRPTIAAELGAEFVCAALAASALPTRPRTAGSKSQTIDHVFVGGGLAVDPVVTDVGGLSDHNLVTARVSRGPIP